MVECDNPPTAPHNQNRKFKITGDKSILGKTNWKTLSLYDCLILKSSHFYPKHEEICR